MDVRMFTFYKDLAQNLPVSQLKQIQHERDSKLFSFYRLHNIPLFPMPLQEFVRIIPLLEEVSKTDETLCMAFVIETCLILNNGNYTEFKSLEEAQRTLMGANNREFIQIVNKYKVEKC